MTKDCNSQLPCLVFLKKVIPWAIIIRVIRKQMSTWTGQKIHTLRKSNRFFPKQTYRRLLLIEIAASDSIFELLVVL